MCIHYNRCEVCGNFNSSADIEHRCRVFGLCTGDGEPFCGSFSCVVSDCSCIECVSDDDLLETYGRG